MAIKPSYGEKYDKLLKLDVPFNMQKKPATDLTKSSKPGHQKLSPSMGSFISISSANSTPAVYNGYVDSLQTVLKNGVFTPTKFETILANTLI